VSFTLLRRWTLVGGLALISTGMYLAPLQSSAQQAGEITRKVKSKVAPTYPDLARRMNISGVVRLAVTVAPNGSVKNIKILGGHPLLASAAEEAVRKWRFEPASEENSGVVELTFRPDR
jgi:TonB family protein